jgi:hypothetical protein
MKLYVLMTSLVLVAGVSLGFWTGQGSARSGFISGCSSSAVVALYDHRARMDRHFHCVELGETESASQPEVVEPSSPFRSDVIYAL